MKILLIGGPKFVGRAIIDAALAAGHEVTTFNRGQTNPELYPEIEKLHGNRDGDLEAIKGRTWDVAIDTVGYIPRIVRQTAELLQDSVKTYVFVSTISVYAGSLRGVDENGELQEMPEGAPEDQVTGETYGALKVLCENIVLDIYGDRAIITRPGMIVGPYDITYRFPYWVKRVAEGGQILYPKDHFMQFIDVRDHARFIMHLLETGQTGVFSTTGPEQALSFREVLETIKEVSGSDAEFVGVSDEFLLSHEVGPWMEVPFWNPEDVGWSQLNVSKSVEAGMIFRPASETIRDTLDWLNSHQLPSPFPTGLSPERESELIQHANTETEREG
jgi:2'-hydroxyisoflavone reductase